MQTSKRMHSNQKVQYNTGARGVVTSVHKWGNTWVSKSIETFDKVLQAIGIQSSHGFCQISIVVLVGKVWYFVRCII